MEVSQSSQARFEPQSPSPLKQDLNPGLPVLGSLAQHTTSMLANYTIKAGLRISKMADNMAMDTGKLVKMEVDYESTCDEKIPECIKMAKEGKTEDALDSLLALEKQTRTGADMVSTGRVLVAIVQICFEAKNWSALNEHILLLSKRRSQLKQAVAKMVQECCKYVDQAPDKETKVKLIDTLRTVTEGKIYVEVERARLTHKLAKMKEDDGDVVEAANIIQELQVETYGSMNKKEKVELILEQMRLCLAKKDYVRTQIISKKVNTKFFDDEGTQELKLKYYRLGCKYCDGGSDQLKATDVFSASSEQGRKRWQDLRSRVVEHNIRIMAKYYTKISVKRMSELLDLSPEVSSIRVSELLELSPEVSSIRVSELLELSPEVSNSRVSELLDLSPEVSNIRVSNQQEDTRLVCCLQETEEILSQLVVSKAVTARTDRPAGVVSFTHSQDPGAVLTQWSEQLSSLMQLVNRTTHLINKEEMVHKHLLATATIKE
uniref:PCI domain-containing protein n=2 Tax=Timema TaxID=61471 RepID=A0A7R9B1F8_TIMSH|nr:unnamed protein product [Timema shepardi]